MSRSPVLSRARRVGKAAGVLIGLAGLLSLPLAGPAAAADPTAPTVVHRVAQIEPKGATPAVTGVLDQGNPPANVETWFLYHSAQTFSAGRAGTLTGADLYLDEDSSSANVTVYVRNVNPATGEPTGANLDSASLSVPALTSGWVHFDFAGHVLVSVGTKYALVIALGPCCNTYVAWGSPYAAGEGMVAQDSGDSTWNRTDSTYGAWDFAFRTYVGAIAATVPGKPLGVTAVAGNAQATVSWSAPSSNGGATITGYTVTSSPGTKHCTTPGGLTCVVGGLTNGQPYTFTVTATNSVGTGPASSPSASVTPVAPTSGVDQQNLGGGGMGTWYSGDYAQTFTAGATGRLTGVDLFIDADASVTVRVWICALDGNGMPTGPKLDGSSATVPAQSGRWIHFTLSEAVSVVPGAKYAIVFDLGTDYNTHAAWGYSYSRGQGLKATNSSDTAWSNQDAAYGTWDFAFRTYVSIVVPATYHPMVPVRLLDTRYANGHAGKLTAGVPITFKVTGRTDKNPVVPAGASAVTGNLTVTGSSAGWAAYLGPSPLAAPSSSTINFTAGQTIANGLTVALSSSGSLSATYLGPSGATTDLVFDVTGYYTPDATGQTYHPIDPVRDVDTRKAVGLSSKLRATVPACFRVAGVNNVPSAAKAVTGNVTVANPTSAWALYAGPDATSSPTTSTLNFAAGETASNNVTVALNSAGQLCTTYLGPVGASTELVFDVTGYYTADSTGAAFVAVTPVRILDTRYGTGLSGTFRVGQPRTLTVGGANGIPATATGITGNLTVTNETSGWAIYLGPTANGAPSTSALNFVVGDVRANGVSVALSTAGTLSPTYLGPNGATTHLVLDVTGYFTK